MIADPAVDAVLLALLDRLVDVADVARPAVAVGPGVRRYPRPELQLGHVVSSTSRAVTDLERHAAAVHPVGAVHHARRPARIHARPERLPLAEVDQLPLQDPDFLPEVVSDRPPRLHAGLEPQQARDVAGLGIAAEDLLLHAGAAGAAGRGGSHRLPRQRVRTKELVLGLGHGSAAQRLHDVGVVERALRLALAEDLAAVDR